MNFPETIIEALFSSAAADEAVFCRFVQARRETVITFGDLRREARRFAGFYRAQGVQPGEVVVIILRHSPELMPAFLGAMLAGAVPSFMPGVTVKQAPALYWSSHRKLFDRIGSGALLTAGANHEAIRLNLPGLPLRLLAVEAAASCAADYADAAPAADAVALLQHSSGTTGLKKGVALTHRAVLAQLASYAEALQLTAADRIVSWLPLYHDMGLVACFLLPLVTRTPLVLLDAFEWVVNPRSLFDAIREHRGTLCWQPNFAYHHLCRTVRPAPPIDLSSMRAWIDCSEPCRPETADLFVKTFAASGVRAAQFQVCYAMAETVFAVTQTRPGESPRALAVDRAIFQAEGRVVAPAAGAAADCHLAAGRPIAGLELRIVDATGAELPEGRVGEIAVAGACLFSGYYKLPDVTAKKLRGGWYHTGDLGFRQGGELFVTGRRNDLIIVHGRNYYAHELEYVVNQVAGVHPGRSVAVGWFRPECGSEEVVVIAEAEPTLPDCDHLHLQQEIKQSLLTQSGLQVFDVHLVPPGWLVKTTSGKLSREANLAKYLSAPAESAARPAA